MSSNGAPSPSWIARWRQRLIKLPESIFFDLVRCYIGEIRSPFNKQDLLQRLENFITRTEIKSRVVAMLNFEDRKLLSTVRMIPGLSEDKLHELAGPDRSYLDFHIRVVNLEDRLLVWREDEQGGIRLNPHFEALLTPYLADSLVLDEAPQIATSKPATEQSHSRPWLDDGFLAAIFSFIQENPELFTAQDQVRKRALQEFSQRFAGLRDTMGIRQEPDYGEILLLVIRGFRLLGLVHNEGEGTQLDYERWLELASLSQERRIALVTAAILYPRPAELLDSEGRVAFFHQPKIADFGRSLYAWARRVDCGRSFGETALKTLWTVESEQGSKGADDSLGISVLPNAAKLGLFSQAGRSWTRNDWNSVLSPSENRPVLKVEASLDIVLTGRPPLMDLLVLAACTSLQSYGFVSVYKLGQNSARQGFAKSIDDKSLVSLLERLSGSAVPQSVSFSAGEWYRDFASVRIIDGIVVIAEGRRKIEIEHSVQIRPFVIARPTENVFVLDRRAVSDWLPMLEDIGVRTGLRVADFPATAGNTRFLPPLMSLDLNKIAFPPSGSGASTAASGENTDETSAEAPLLTRQALMEDLKRVLDGLELTDEHRQAFTERLRGGLILSPEQIVPGALRLEHSEARGLDYTGKIRIIEQAIKIRSDFLEVQTRGDDAQTEGSWRMLIWPQKLRQMGSDLVLIAQTVPEGRELSIMISRVLSVKRVRGSIFG